MNEKITAGPAYWADASPIVTKMPAPTTLAMPMAVRLNGPIAAESSRLRSILACATTASILPAAISESCQSAARQTTGGEQ